jgi:HD superfamily phosphohydrolase
MIEKMPEKYLSIWNEASPILKKARPGDFEHSLEVVNLILNYKGNINIDLEILIPVAIMHDIGHSALLPEHFKFVTGSDKLINGKLAHMLAGAKIAHDILEKVGFATDKSKEIIDIISVHDADQLQGILLEKWYDTENKKIFHDLDSMDRYTETRLKSVKDLYPDRDKLLSMLEKSLDSFFFEEFRNLAKERLQKLV